MNKDFININLKSNCLINGTTLYLKNKCNKIVCIKKINNLEKIKLPIYNKNTYKLEIHSKGRIINIPIYAIRGYNYSICLDNKIENKKGNIKNIIVYDSNYNKVNIKEGEITLWQ